MIPWEHIGSAEVPGTGELMTLQKRGSEFSIRTAGTELMNSRRHGSEDELAELALRDIEKKTNSRILIGGLGMGFTLSAALKSSPQDAYICVAELVPEIANWNRNHFGSLADFPLDDPRTELEIEDVTRLIQNTETGWDIILLDVDNGPEGLTRPSNSNLYTPSGLKAAYKALIPGGILGVWSCRPDPDFTRRLKQAKFNVRAIPTWERKSKKGAKHMIWLAKKSISRR